MERRQKWLRIYFVSKGWTDVVEALDAYAEAYREMFYQHETERLSWYEVNARPLWNAWHAAWRAAEERERNARDC